MRLKAPNIEASMHEAAEDAAWDYDHPILSTLRDIGAFILGAIVAIVALVVLIVVVILAFKAIVVLAVAAGIAAAIVKAVIVIAGLALIAYGIYEAYQDRIRAGEEGGWGTFGRALLDFAGLTDIYRAFAAPGLTPFERGLLFGEGLVKLVTTVLMIRGAWRFVVGGGLRSAWRSLIRGVRRLPGRIRRGWRDLKRLGKGLTRKISKGVSRIRKFLERAFARPRRRELGTDPRKGTFSKEEADAATRLERRVGRLRREPSGDYDWIDTSGKTYDAVGPVPRGRFNAASFNRQIDKHLLKQGLDFVVVDLTGLTPAERALVETHIAGLTPGQRARIIMQ